MQEKKEDKYSFINEKIKEKPLNKRRLVLHVGYMVGMAVTFGLIASLVFAIFQPKFAELLYPKQEPQISIPKDDVVETEVTEQPETEDAQEEGAYEGNQHQDGSQIAEKIMHPCAYRKNGKTYCIIPQQQKTGQDRPDNPGGGMAEPVHPGCQPGIVVDFIGIRDFNSCHNDRSFMNVVFLG